jgi:uncharacterized membrane protein (DUF4010 family)
VCERGVPRVLLATFLPVSALLFAGYSLVSRAQGDMLGLTTEIAPVVVFLLGAVTLLGHRELAIGLGVVTATVLAYKQLLHARKESACRVCRAMRLPVLFSRLAPGNGGVTVV